jgi:signal transduction histidine kinase
VTEVRAENHGVTARLRGAAPAMRDITSGRRDVLVAAALTAAVELELLLEDGVEAGPRAASAVAGLAVLGLVWRRTHPIAAFAILLAALAGQQLLDGVLLSGLATPYVAVVVAAFSLGAHARGAGLAAGLALGVAGLTLASRLDPANEYSVLDDLVWFAAFMVGAPALAGRLLASRARLLADLRGRTARLERERESAAEAARLEERDRLAGELHDALAHRIGEIALQAAGAERVAARDPGRALEALEQIEATARAGLSDIREVLGVLRRGDEDIALAPQPTLARLDALVAGRDVTVEVEGERGHVPAGADLTAYRVVQEALGDGPAGVLVRYEPRAIELEIAGVALGSDGALAMRERIAPYGGRLRHAGGVVRARIPHEGAP